MTNLEKVEAMALENVLKIEPIKEKNILGDILVKIKPISNFEEEFQIIMKGICKQDVDNLAIFYEEDIVLTLKKHNTCIKNENGLYYIWSGKYWKSLETAAFKRFIKTYIRKRGLTQHRSAKIIEATYKNINLTYGGIKYNQGVDQKLNLNNGVLTIKRDKILFENHNKNFHLNYLLDFDYNKESVNQRWLNFLDDVLPNKDTQKTLQQIVGNLLIRGMKIEVLPFLYGTGGNGKSVVIEVLTGLFGAENVTTYSLTKITTDERVRAKIADGKIMNLSSENNMGNVNVDVAKIMASNEPMDARLNYGNPFEIYNYAKFLGSINKLSVMDGERTEAIARRQIIVPFMQKISALGKKIDLDIHKKILRDKSGVLNWILDGIKEVVKNQAIFKSQEIKDLLYKYQEDTNPVKQMLLEHNYNILKSGEIAMLHFASLQDLYKEYAEFTVEIGVGRLSRTNFKADLVSVEGIQEVHYRNKTCFNISKLFKDTIEVETQDKDNNTTGNYTISR